MIPTRISAPLKNIIDRVNPGRIQETTAAILRNDQYLVTLPVESDEFITLVYDTVRGRWREWDVHIRHACESVDYYSSFFTTTQSADQVCRLARGVLKDYDLYPIEAVVDTMELHMGAPKLEKEVNNLWVGYWLSDHRAYMGILCRTDMGDWHQVGPGVHLEGNDTDYMQVMIPIHALGRSVQFRLFNDRIDEDLRLLDMIVTFLPKELE